MLRETEKYWKDTHLPSTKAVYGHLSLSLKNKKKKEEEKNIPEGGRRGGWESGRLALVSVLYLAHWRGELTWGP